MKQLYNINKADYNYEEHTWGHKIDLNGLDFPRLKFDYLFDVLHSKKPEKVLEVGCGAGKFIFALADRFPQTHFTGVDISMQAISKAKSFNQSDKIDFLIGDAGEMKFIPGSFDAIILLDVLEHVQNPQKVIQDCCSFLKKGGMLHTFIPCEAQSIYWLSEKLIGFHTKERTAGHVQRFTRKNAVSLFTDKLTHLETKYSFHLLGSSLDYLLFTALLSKRLKNVFWNENKYYTAGSKKLRSRILNGLLTFGSSIGYLESKILQDQKFLATGVHLTFRKDK